MGMFDIVLISMKCPECGYKISEFQSKDASCTMSYIPYNKVDHFYTNCDKCNTWIEFWYDGNKSLKDYKGKIKPPEGKQRSISNELLKPASSKEISKRNHKKIQRLKNWIRLNEKRRKISKRCPQKS